MQKKGLLCGIVVLLVGMCVMPLASSLSIEKHVSIASSTKETGPGYVNWTINGTMGKNGWYISPITLTCTYDHDWYAGVYYSYNASGFVLYTGPFTIYDQGRIGFAWYTVDYQGNQGGLHGPFTFGIDYTPPEVSFWTPVNNTLYLFGKKLLHIDGISIIIGKITIELAASDRYTGIANLSCALANTQNTITHEFDSTPFLWKISGRHLGTYTLSAIAYNFAGLCTNTTIQVRLLQFGI